ncbi:restriction endonuclease fold toxin-2 domain-containing protein [Kribbella sp. CA-253562]|uniref:restriction endonuclease fold toxin-2 domain-containing protein n=1 Tax=Kribbella sp. CA-253562 TaxID=3239942 RepID=UPI003D89C9C9
MPSDLQRVARGLVECLDEVPQVVVHLQRTADRCRENAAMAIAASHGQATVAAQQLDAAARACEAAAHYLSMAPPKAKAWAERLVGEGRSTNRPDSGSADRNKATGAGGDVAERDARGRTKRLTARFKPVEDPETPEPPLIKVARKAFEQLRKKQDKDAEEREKEQPEEELEVEIVVDPKGELRAAAKAAEDEVDEEREKEQPEEELEVEIVVDPKGELRAAAKAAEDEDDDEERRDDEPAYEIAVDLGDAARELLEAMAESGQQRWERAELVIEVDRVTANFEYAEEPDAPEIAVPVVDVELPDFSSVDEESSPSDTGKGSSDRSTADGNERPAGVDADFGSYRQRLTESGRIRPIVGSGPEMEFQRRYCGPVEFRLTTDDRLPRAVWADGLDALLRRAQDAKYVAPASAKSFYRPESLPPFLRKIAEEKNDHMLMKYREVIKSQDNPVEGLEIITNDPTPAMYFRDRMAKLDIPGQVTVEQEDDV